MHVCVFIDRHTERERALGAVTPKLGDFLQQIPGTTSTISVQKSAVLGAATILCRTLNLPGL